MRSTPQGVQRLADDLVRDGPADFRPNPDHRGSLLLEPTPEGHRVPGGITDRAAEVHRTLSAGIAPGDIVAARELPRQVIDRVRRHEDA
ncbi:hypothetical protein [Streptomyces sp. NPDC048643]|uniref:hypothetical protein n=1 Tax=Streptomyces sp. NPDC048643 TaxID=3155637 RepID=UPI003448C128